MTQPPPFSPHPGHPGPWQAPAPQPQAPYAPQPAPWPQPQAQAPFQPQQPWQQGPWAAQPGVWAGQPAWQPPRRRNRLGLFLGLAIGVVALLFAGLAVSSWLSGPAYANEDYSLPAVDTNPPRIPVPKNEAEIDQFLKNNPLYNQKIAAPVRCELPPIDMATADDAALEKFYNDQIACLTRVWGPAVEATGRWSMTRPSVTVYDDRISTPCGDAKVNAFYCGANQQIYFSRRLPRAKGMEVLRKTPAAEYVIAHEYGHFIQGRSGIVAANSLSKKAAKDPETVNRLTRYSEAQTDCFAGLYARSVTQSRGYTQADLDTLYAALEAAGDEGGPGEGDHGVPATRHYWGQLGMSTDSIGQCNSWVRPEKEVR